MIARNEPPHLHLAPNPGQAAAPVGLSPTPDAGTDADATLRELHDARAAIAALQHRVAELESQLTETQDSGTATFNHMVHLANQAAETIVANAHARTERLHAQPAPTLVTEPGADTEAVVLNEEGATEFHEAWKREATFDERFADQSFFDIEYDDASRRWILDETA